VETAAGRAAAASTAALDAEAALPPLREESTIAQAVLQKLHLEKDRSDRDEAQARADIERLSAALRHLAVDAAREEQVVDDAVRVLSRLGSETLTLEAEIAAAPERLPELEAAARAAEAARAAADREVEQLAAELAAEEARIRAAVQRRTEAQARVRRAEDALAGAHRERAALTGAAQPEGVDAQTRHEKAQAAVGAARQAVEAAEAERASAGVAEAAAREESRKLQDALGRLQAEARGLAQLAVAPVKAAAPVLDQVTPARGYEAALAAALGDDLNAPLDPAAALHWAGADAAPPAWPAGVEPLSAHVQAPAQLTARLAHVGVVEQAHGERLRTALPPGARLVSRQGDLWRWDGFVARAEAPRPAAIRLAQKTRLAELAAEIEATSPRVQAAASAQAEAVERVRGAEAQLRTARAAVGEAERSAAGARDALERHTRELARRDARLQALDETLERLGRDAERARDELAAVEADGGSADTAAPATAQGAQALAAAREAASRAREAAAQARAALDAERREREGRERRLSTLRADAADWTRRSAAASARVDELGGRRTSLDAQLAAARLVPARLTVDRDRLLDELGAAEVRRARAADALTMASPPAPPPSAPPARRTRKAPPRAKPAPRPTPGWKPRARGWRKPPPNCARPPGWSPTPWRAPWPRARWPSPPTPAGSRPTWRRWSAGGTPSARSTSAPRRRPANRRRGWRC
jgi:chromosome segregation protein